MDIKQYIEHGTVIQCETLAENIEFMELLDELNYTWIGGERYTEISIWEIYESETCYNIPEHCFSRKNYYENPILGYEIVKFSTIKYSNKPSYFISTNTLKREFNNGHKSI